MRLLPTLLLSLLLSSSTFLVAAERVLKQIHVLTRHGARTELAKDADSLAEEGGEALTPLGQQQLYKMGEWLRQHYINYNNDGDRLSLEYYNPALHRLQSSNFERTLSSANALALGLFPNPERATASVIMDSDSNSTPPLLPTFLPNGVAPAIPVYSIKDENDIYLRAYHHCPQFHDNLQWLYEIDEWKNGEKMNESLLRKLANIFPEYAVDGKIPMKDLWNVYDPIHVAVTECVAPADGENDNSVACDALVPLPSLATVLSNTDFAALERLAHEVEFLKFGRQETAGNLLGSNLLWQILERVAEHQRGTFFLYSAHVPTLLGFLTTLQASQDFVKATGEKFIDYGGALILELYEDINDDKVGNGLFIKLKYKSLEKDRPVAIPLKEGSDAVECGGTDDSGEDRLCGLSKFSVWATANTLVGAENWCNACGNEYADVCLRSKYLVDDGKGGYRLDPPMGGNSASSSSSMQPGDSSGTPSGVIVAVAFLVGFAAGLLALGFAGYLCGFPPVLQKQQPGVNPKHTTDGVVVNDSVEKSVESSDTPPAFPEPTTHDEIAEDDDVEDYDNHKGIV
jgi:hypothetical protein